MFVTAKIYVNEESVLAVPLAALESEGESNFIFVRTNEKKEIRDEHKHEEEGAEHNHDEERKDEHKEGDMKSGIVFKKILVNTGISDDKYIQIFPIEELKQGDEVVAKGTFYLKAELKKEELGGHEH
jgi:cobalt-zinc-cadmium efflux system membrane fusion protein